MSTKPTDYYEDGKRYDLGADAPDLDAMAQQAGYESFDQMSFMDPEGAQGLQNQYGNPDNGLTRTQVANSDDLSTGRLIGLIGAAAAAGLIPGVAAGYGGSSAAPALLSSSVPTATGLPGGVLASGAALPGAVTLPSAASATAGLATGAASTGAASTAAPAATGSEFASSAPYTTQAGDIGGAGGAAGAGGVMSRVGQLMRLGAPVLGNVVQANANNRENANATQAAYDRLALQAWEDENRLKMDAAGQLERQLIDRANLERGDRSEDLRNLYRQSYAQNMPTSPFNRRPMKLSDAFVSALNNVGRYAGDELARAPQYRAATLPQATLYTPTPAPTISRPQNPAGGTLSQVGQWLAPALYAAGQFF